MQRNGLRKDLRMGMGMVEGKNVRSHACHSRPRKPVSTSFYTQNVLLVRLSCMLCMAVRDDNDVADRLIKCNDLVSHVWRSWRPLCYLAPLWDGILNGFLIRIRHLSHYPSILTAAMLSSQTTCPRSGDEQTEVGVPWTGCRTVAASRTTSSALVAPRVFERRQLAVQRKSEKRDRAHSVARV